MNIYETLQNSATAFHDRIAIHDEFGSLTYKELFSQTEKLRLHLLSLGVSPNTGIALITENSRYFIIGLYAGIGCNAVVMPVSAQQRPDEIRKALAEAQLHFILTDKEDHCEFGTGKESIDLFSEPLYLCRTGKNIKEATVPFIADVAFMRFTSGTTGSSKCVILSHRSVMERIEAANEALEVTADDNVVWVLPMAYHFIVSIVLYIRYGAGIIICNDFLAEHLLGKIQNHRGTLLYASPMHIRLLAAFTDRVQLPSLRLVISTTTAVNPEHCQIFHEKYKVHVHQAFGIIEVGLPIINMLHAEQHPEAIGRALSAYEVAILDQDYQPLPAGSSGLLSIKGPGMFDGYLSPPTQRSEVLKNGWFVTGDYASVSVDGVIEIKGREKAMINVSGNKVFPDEVEDVINSFNGIDISKVYGQSHPLFGEVVVADVVLRSGAQFNEEELIGHCRKALSAFKVPQQIKVVDSIEMTDSGKIKRK
jgi:acyl-coenzyme A synthetase/AMP-(fatty) acid ligase